MAVRRASASALLMIFTGCGVDAGLSFGGAGGAAGATALIVVVPPSTGGTVDQPPDLDAGAAQAEVDASVPFEEEVEVFDLESEFVENPCPPVEEEPESLMECSPFAEPTGCAEGEGCYPLAIYPSDPCQPETFGSECGPAGSGMQGDPCATDFDCSGGFACVVSSLGTECVALCPRHADQPCQPGLICVAIDVDGFGVCL